MNHIFKIFTLFMFSLSVCSAQSENQIIDLISESINIHLSNKKLDRVVFLSDNICIDSQFYNKINSKYEITFFNKSKYSNSAMKKGIISFKVLPIILTDNILSITIVKVLIIKKGNSIVISSSDYSSYEYQYSCDKRQWILFEVIEKGI